MAVFRWGSPFHAMQDLERELDRWLRSVDFTMDGLRVHRQYPAVNIYETDDEFLLTAELPGLKAEDLELSVSDGLVTLRGIHRDEGDVSQDRFRRSERPRGEWERTLTLPARVRDEKLHAELAHGVLMLHLPKAPSAQPRQIRVVESPRTATATESQAP